ncbi:PilW family protein [Aeromonas hydrophila]|jgi:prepilin-type N-terminal cleavage/methylation domain-containing protein|uniref:PilW family protein n=1 Tax=Aeromonas hydrophila TaxID=644 RepID=UPI00069235E3|nr:prepilin-type N-terminal cleavage/methylation domain-containing protein [Aeromonas hydrophila]EJN6955011.1 prepilin-type N-terminal cleavage/methylation domain-containing protein [Aeromonas hydrophila]MCX4040515.1 prepilin-type N-terminal cleavage/methylation domain-containing protein [Aeromonas hydrophila]OCA62337.1 type IV pilin [Aeromonas hydrophila]OCY09178.1 type IV pilin [Aeromonas hydrophila]OCY10312.1 type IV pilin [Aeromonas hydrophila]
MQLKVRGFNLVELMVAMVAGLLLVAAVISLFATILKANYTAMQTSRLNQEVQLLTDMIARDIQRAGYDANATQFLAAPSGSRSSFYFDAAADLMSETATGSGLYTCIRVRYDNDENGVLSSDDTLVYSYSSSSKGIKQGTGTTTCGNGSLISSDDTIEITAMTLKLLTSSQTNGARALQLVVSGRFKATPALTLTLQRDIKLRNDGY